MAGKLAGTKTEKNLHDAFAGESMARNKYTFFAGEARPIRGWAYVDLQLGYRLLDDAFRDFKVGQEPFPYTGDNYEIKLDKIKEHRVDVGRLFDDLVTDESLPDFLTLRAYRHLDRG